MKRLFVTGLAAGLVLGIGGAVAPASAQSVEFGPGGVRINPPGFERGGEVSRREAVRIARSQGLREIDSVSRRGRLWSVEGLDRRGRDITVEVNARNGRVVNVY